MWINYSDSEVNVYHPICESALNNALQKIGIDDKYCVKHHQYTGSLEMDFVVQNITTGKYLCVIEVKRTPTDIHSARYQYQAMSYVQMNTPNNEKTFYILTNLESTLAFRYDPDRPRVVQQMLQPGLIQTGNFFKCSKEAFLILLEQLFSTLLISFHSDDYAYMVTLEQFECHLRHIQSKKTWKSNLAILLYEYIRGAFVSVGRQDLPHDVRKFHNNVIRICSEATRVNFKEIFGFSPDYYDESVSITNEMLAHIFDLGKQTISGDSVAELLHSVASYGKAHLGEVPTDLELARAISVLAKSISGAIPCNKYICDPAAGSGNLITSAIDIFNITPIQIKANDINTRLLELLSLRLGLCFPLVINSDNSAVISASDICDLDSSYFSDVSVIIMNPPFLAGINCVALKQKLFSKIKTLTGRKAKTLVGQMNYEGVFLETICSFCTEGTTVACVLPKTHLTARGPEAVALRKFLLTNFGLKIVFSYPEEGLFQDVMKGTCVVVGKVRSAVQFVKFITSHDKVSDIDLKILDASLHQGLKTDEFTSLAAGIDGISRTNDYLVESINDGWRQMFREHTDAIKFIEEHIVSNVRIAQLSSIDDTIIRRKRGSGGNSGASDLVFMDRSSKPFQEYKNLPSFAAMRNAKMQCLDVGMGDSAFIDITRVSATVSESLVGNYLSRPIKQSRQQRAVKTREDILRILTREAKKVFPSNSILLPRAIRTIGKVYLTKNPTVVSTNFVVLTLKSKSDAILLSTWFCTLFYQLICEVNSKQQEGMRKMEVNDIETTFVPVLSELADHEKDLLVAESSSIEFVKLHDPTIRKIDSLWARILFKENAESRLLEAKRLLEFLSNSRNPKYPT